MTDPSGPKAWGIQMSKLWLTAGQTFPIDVRVLAPELTRQRFNDPIVDVLAHGISGIDGMLSRRKKGDWVISYDESVTVPGRVNFTLAHEFGHYLCHRHLREQFRCGASELLDYDGGASRKIEKEANEFASYLLMPADDFRTQLGGVQVTLDVLSDLTTRYQTSLTATTLKWLELTEEAAMLVVARDGFVCWSYPSRAASRAGAYLSPGTELADEVVKRVSASTNGSRSEWLHVPTGVWNSSMETEEAMINSDKFEMSIFLLRFPSARFVDHDDADEPDAFDGLEKLAKGLGWAR
jgi:hypothetical protein